MKKLSLARRLSLAVAVLAVAALAGFGLLTPEVDAAVPDAKMITWYSGPDKTEVVGIYERYCSGTVLRYGRATRFKAEYTFPCF